MPANARNTSTLPLAGIKVIDIANFLAGPMSSMFLGDYGAEVVKVERPGTGDEVRYWGNNKNGVGLMYKFIRSEEHTSELQSLMRISYAVFCLKQKKQR